MPAKKYLLWAAAAALLLVIVSTVFLFCGESGLEVHFLKVGQGDSILIESPAGQNILIDGGPDNAAAYEVKNILPFYDRTIDLMVLTHPHADHVVGLVEILRRFDVRQVLYTGIKDDTAAYSTWLKGIEDEGADIKKAALGERINLGKELYLEVLWPAADLSGETSDNLNNTSVVLRLVHGKVEFLLAGDAEKEVEKYLLASGINLSADILKVGHHGSDTSSSEDFLRAVSPEAAVLCYALDNKFGLPSLRTVDRLERLGVKVFDTLERVSFRSDGERVILIND